MVISESLAPGVGVLLRRAKVGTERFFLQLSFQFCLLLKQVLLVAAADRGNKTTIVKTGCGTDGALHSTSCVQSSVAVLALVGC